MMMEQMSENTLPAFQGVERSEDQSVPIEEGNDSGDSTSPVDSLIAGLVSSSLSSSIRQPASSTITNNNNTSTTSSADTTTKDSTRDVRSQSNTAITTAKPKKSAWTPPKGAKRWIPPSSTASGSTAAKTSAATAASASSSSSSSHPLRVSLMDIMAEQTENKKAAQVAYGDSNVSLATFERDQERLLRSVEQQQHDPSGMVAERNNNSDATIGTMEEEDEILLETIRRSLLEYEKEANPIMKTSRDNNVGMYSSNSPDSVHSSGDVRTTKRMDGIEGVPQLKNRSLGGEGASSSTTPPRRIASLVDLRGGRLSPDESSTSNFRSSRNHSLTMRTLNRGGVMKGLSSSSARNYQTMSMRDLSSGISMFPESSIGSSASSLDYNHRTNSPSLLRSVNDREFSRRTFEEIERAQAVVDNPHTDARERRKRLNQSRTQSTRPTNVVAAGLGSDIRSRSESLVSPSSNVPATTSAGSPIGSGDELSAGVANFSEQEIREIEQAIHEADVHRPQTTQLDRSHDYASIQSSRPVTSKRSSWSFPARVPQDRPAARLNRSAYTSPSTSYSAAHGLTLNPPTSQHPVKASLPQIPQSTDREDFQEYGAVSEEDALAIERAILEADAKDEEMSLMLAFQMQQEEINRMNNKRQQQQPHLQRAQGNVRTMTRAELDRESQRVGNAYQTSSLFGAMRPRGIRRHSSLDGARQQPIIDADVVRVGAVYTREPPARHPLEAQVEGTHRTSVTRHEDKTEGAGSRRNSDQQVRRNSDQQIPERKQQHQQQQQQHQLQQQIQQKQQQQFQQLQQQQLQQQQEQAWLMHDRSHEKEELMVSAGFRINSAQQQRGQQQAWLRHDQNTIIGPNNELRTKHDTELQGQSNAERLALEADEFGTRAHVGNQAFNSFKKSMKRTTKGVASHGTGRAGSDADGTKEKAMDPQVRLQIIKAINRGLIDKCNGAVKQGKEAIVYHADGGIDGGMGSGYDVAVKVFKRITEFRGRGEYVDGDPRYKKTSFRKAGCREQLAMWTMKEYRNLVRADQAMVPVPKPLSCNDNVLFMRFLGNGAWPAPQLKEIDIRKNSKKWISLYDQVMDAIRRLYVHAHLVHGDLSEYNILVAPASQVQNSISDKESNKHQAVLIDFGQAVDCGHPESKNLLKRDLQRVNAFFAKQGVTTRSLEEAIEFVEDDFDSGDDFDDCEEEIIFYDDEGEEDVNDTTSPNAEEGEDVGEINEADL